MVFIKYSVYYVQNISENEESLLSYSKVLTKKETFTANHYSFPQDFLKQFSEHDVFHKVQWPEDPSVNTWIILILKLRTF